MGTFKSFLALAAITLLLGVNVSALSVTSSATSVTVTINDEDCIVTLNGANVDIGNGVTTDTSVIAAANLEILTINWNVAQDGRVLDLSDINFTDFSAPAFQGTTFNQGIQINNNDANNASGFAQTLILGEGYYNNTTNVNLNGNASAATPDVIIWPAKRNGGTMSGTVFGGFGDDEIYINGDLDIDGVFVLLEGGGGNDAVTFNAELINAATTFVGSTVGGGNGNEVLTFNVAITDANAIYQDSASAVGVSNGNDTFVFNVPPAAGTFIGGGGNDAFTLNPAPTGPITIDGGTGTDSMAYDSTNLVSDNGSVVTYSTAGQITYSDIENITALNAPGVQVDSDASSLTVFITGSDCTFNVNGGGFVEVGDNTSTQTLTTLAANVTTITFIWTAFADGETLDISAINNTDFSNASFIDGPGGIILDMSAGGGDIYAQNLILGAANYLPTPFGIGLNLRDNPTSAPDTITFPASLSGERLNGKIFPGPGNDLITVNGDIDVTGSDFIMDGGAGDDTVEINGQLLGDVDDVSTGILGGGAGADIININVAITQNGDYIGQSEADVITINAAATSGTFNAGSGADTVNFVVFPTGTVIADGGDGIDTILFDDSTGAEPVDTNTLSDGIGTILLTNFEIGVTLPLTTSVNNWYVYE